MLTLLAKPVADQVKAAVSGQATTFKQRTRRSPKLVVILVGENPASIIYTRKKGEAAVSVGMEHETVTFSDKVNPAEVRALIHKLNADPTVDGILIQRPLPSSFKESELIYWIAPEKDVDAFHPSNVGLLSLGMPCLQPCTPAGVMKLLDHYQISPKGKLACVVGRSSIVGKPMAALLLQANATVIQCHSQTKDLESLTRQADILIAAAGKPKLINTNHVKNGATVIDVGIHRQADGKICGDVDFETASRVAGAITPVPGGVGPMTIAMLLQNTMTSALNGLSRKET